MKVIAITAIGTSRLIVHDFPDEETARRVMPVIITWEWNRTTWKSENQCRVFSKKAKKYYASRKINDKITGTTYTYTRVNGSLKKYVSYI